MRRNNRQYQKPYSNNYGYNNRYSNNNYYNDNYYHKDYYDNSYNNGHNRSNQNYDNSRRNNNYNNSYKSNNYNRNAPQFKEVEITDTKENEKKKYDKNEVEGYVKQINETIDPSELKDFCLKDKETIKVSEKECAINSDLMLLDISIAIKGPEEELAYLKHPNYISIIRRGNTLLEVYTFNKRINDYEYEKSLLIMNMKNLY